ALLLALHAPAQNPPRSPLPNKAAQDKAMTLLLDVFGEDFKKADSAASKAKLASLLFQQGKEVKDDDAVRYVCLREARDLAAQGNDTGLALAIVDEISRGYQVDALTLKADVLSLAVASAADKEAGAALVEVIRPLLAEAVDLDQYPAAHQLGKAAIDAAKKAKSPSLVLELQKRAEEVRTIEKSFAKVQGYLDRVKKNADDGEANLELGKYFGFQKKRWEKALPYFAATDSPGIKQAARQDLQDPKDTKDQLALADNWWTLADDYKNGGKLAIQMRAMFWYEKALPMLSGLNRAKAQKRIDKVQEQLVGTSVVVPIASGPVGELKKYEGHTEEVRSVSFSFDGRYVASGSRDTSVRIWDVTLKETKETQIIRGHTKEVWSVAFHPNNRNVLSASWDATVRMWDFKTGNEAKRWTHPKDVNGLVLSRDGDKMLTGCDDRSAYLWSVSGGEKLKSFPGANDFVYAVAFSPDGRYVAAGGVDKTVRVYDLNTGQTHKTFDGSNESITNVVFTSDSRYVISSGDSNIRMWDLTTGKEAPRRFEGHSGRIPALAISPDGRRLLTGGDDRLIKYWDVATGKMLQSFAGHTDSVTCVAFSHDGRRAVSGGYDRTVRVWGLPSQ
ncbi:MAG: WD40 repeat domain-containing protein, partial [Planctomycetes bacterium]|nr:WD40 repeat domain-containing protein [Planctomycetota bacterium]